MALSDEALMQEIGQGSVRAFEALYGRYRRRLYSFILRYVQDEALAEDLFQDAFLRLLRAAPGWRPQARLSTWLYRVALNLCIDRSRKRSPQVLRPEVAESFADGFADPQDSLQAHEAAESLKAAVALLLSNLLAALLAPLLVTWRKAHGS